MICFWVVVRGTLCLVWCSKFSCDDQLVLFVCWWNFINISYDFAVWFCRKCWHGAYALNELILLFGFFFFIVRFWCDCEVGIQLWLLWSRGCVGQQPGGSCVAWWGGCLPWGASGMFICNILTCIWFTYGLVSIVLIKQMRRKESPLCCFNF